jgi:serine/threonine protein kinase
MLRAATDSNTLIQNEDQSIQIMRKLVSGCYGTVYLGKMNDNDVAVKCFSSDSGIDEYKAMADLGAHRSPYLVKMIAYKPKFLVLEYMENGTLADFIDERRVCNWASSLQILADCSAGLADMHQHGYLHLDIKSMNILLDQNNRAKLGDFGCTSHETDPSKGFLHYVDYFMGTYEYLAPEVWMLPQFSGYSKKSDIFALGVLMLEIAAWDKYHDLILLGLNSNDRGDPDSFHPINWTLRLKLINQFIFKHCPIDLGELIQDCMQLNSSNRPTAKMVKDRLIRMNKIHGEVHQLFFSAAKHAVRDKIAGLVREYAAETKDKSKLRPSNKQLHLEEQDAEQRSRAANIRLAKPTS